MPLPRVYWVSLALLPKSVVAGVPHISAIALRDPVIPWELELAWPRKTTLSYAAQALLEVAGQIKPNKAVE